MPRRVPSSSLHNGRGVELPTDTGTLEGQSPDKN